MSGRISAMSGRHSDGASCKHARSRVRCVASSLLKARRMRILGILLLSSSAALAGTLQTPVVGGKTVAPGAYPDVVAVLASDAMCTGSLVAPDVVLTAGHCIETNPVEVIIGSVDLANHAAGQVIRVKSATAYPKWQSSFDVGVLVLEQPAAVKPIAIASACTAKEHLQAGDSVRVVGFGLTTADGTGDNLQLHEALLPVNDPTCTMDPACEPAVAPGGEFTAGGGGHDSCFGDSGGPIYVDTTKGPSLIGVVSRGAPVDGLPCGGDGVYVRADAVVSWIEKTTGRKVMRSACDGAADGPGDGATDAEAGGCSATRGVVGGGALLGLVVLALLAAPRRMPMSVD
jgi:secreted trypsin-like serine protease